VACPVLTGGALVAHIIPSAKRDDLHRDSRYALHSFPVPDSEDAFYVTGRAEQVADGEFFEFRIGRCLLTRTDGLNDWNARHTVWHASAAGV
jgi:hypothetical protein